MSSIGSDQRQWQHLPLRSSCLRGAKLGGSASINGNGSQGAVVVSGVTTQQRDILATTLSIPLGATLDVSTGLPRIFATQSVTIGGTVRGNGLSAVGATGGVGASGSGSGGNGTTAAGLPGSTVNLLVNDQVAGAVGGAGGAGDANAGGAGGRGSAQVPTVHDVTTVLSNYEPFEIGITSASVGGGGGGGDGVHGGGGGGGGGGVIIICSPLIIVQSTAVLQALGGNGAAGTGGNTGGGGGGNGGQIYLIGTVVQSAGASISVSAGAPGAGSGTGATGGAGFAGEIVTIGP